MATVAVQGTTTGSVPTEIHHTVPTPLMATIGTTATLKIEDVADQWQVGVTEEVLQIGRVGVLQEARALWLHRLVATSIAVMGGRVARHVAENHVVGHHWLNR